MLVSLLYIVFFYVGSVAHVCQSVHRYGPDYYILSFGWIGTILYKYSWLLDDVS